MLPGRAGTGFVPRRATYRPRRRRKWPPEHCRQHGVAGLQAGPAAPVCSPVRVAPVELLARPWGRLLKQERGRFDKKWPRHREKRAPAVPRQLVAAAAAVDGGRCSGRERRGARTGGQNSAQEMCHGLERGGATLARVLRARGSAPRRTMKSTIWASLRPAPAALPRRARATRRHGARGARRRGRGSHMGRVDRARGADSGILRASGRRPVGGRRPRFGRARAGLRTPRRGVCARHAATGPTGRGGARGRGVWHGACVPRARRGDGDFTSGRARKRRPPAHNKKTRGEMSGLRELRARKNG